MTLNQNANSLAKIDSPFICFFFLVGALFSPFSAAVHSSSVFCGSIIVQLVKTLTDLKPAGFTYVRYSFMQSIIWMDSLTNHSCSPRVPVLGCAFLASRVLLAKQMKLILIRFN